MGAHSTIYTTREDAVSFVRTYVENLTDEELGYVMDTFLDKRLVNVSITTKRDACFNEIRLFDEDDLKGLYE